MKLSEVGHLKEGTVVYECLSGMISSFWVIGIHPKSEKTVILGSKSSVKIIETRSFYFDNMDNWETDYDTAKEKAWEILISETNSLNKIWFNNQKPLSLL